MENKKALKIRALKSGRQDSNLRPPGPKPGALPACATSRFLRAQKYGQELNCQKNLLFLFYKNTVKLPVVSGKSNRFVEIDSLNMKLYQTQVLEDIPSEINESEILYFLQTKKVNEDHVNALKSLTGLNDDIISGWLNLSVKTFREYRKPKTIIRGNTKEHIVLLLALLKHGREIFGSAKAFDSWLNTNNFYFNGQSPESFLNTITGIKFVDNRLTAMQFGDNV